MHLSRNSFLYYATVKNKGYLYLALITGILFFIILRLLYPIPSFYSDSYTWVGAAKNNQPVTFRPVGYSKLLLFFKIFSESDVALIAGQYFCNLFTNLFLFFTCLWFFPMRKTYKVVLYLLLIVHPFYLFASNYISSDAFFNCFTVLWFTLLIWMMHKATTGIIIAQLALLAGLFVLRYNAIFFPVISALALLLSRQFLWKKVAYICVSCAIILGIVFFITEKTKSYTGTLTFSAFSGWQLANDALHILPHEKIDTAHIQDKEVKDVLLYMQTYLDTAKQSFPDTAASSVYMWHINSPLKKYMNVYPERKKSYFGTWNALGPVYSRFGETVILQKPFSYITHFVLPNTKAYFFPDLEIYKEYMEKSDTIASIAQKFYHYESNKTPYPHQAVYSVVFEPVRISFSVLVLLFMPLTIFYMVYGKHKYQQRLFNCTLLCFAVFHIANFLFIVFLAPSVIRYHIFILTLSLPVMIYLLQQVTHPLMPERVRKKRKPGQTSSTT